MSFPKLVMLVPTRKRANSAIELVGEFERTAHKRTELCFLVDSDDPQIGIYSQLVGAAQGRVRVMIDVPQRIGPWLNFAGPAFANRAAFVGFMGDDHRPRTEGWDIALMDSLTHPGVAYGNDGHQGANLPTACIMSSAVIKALGYFCPPGLVHLYLDNYWRQLGEDLGNLQYLPEVYIEHMHPAAGKAPMDATYSWTMSREALDADQLRYEEFLAGRWPADLKHLREELDS